MKQTVHTIDGIDIPVWTAGDGGRKFLFLHGWVSDCRLLHPLMECVAETGSRVAAFDMRGYGDRKGAGGPYDCVTMAKEAFAVANALGWDDFALVGHSMGGFVAQYMMTLFPERISGIVLVCPVPASGAKLPADRQATLTLATEDPAERRRLIAANSKGNMSQEQVLAIAQESLSSTVALAMQEYMRDWSEFGFLDKLSVHHIPAGVIMGADDPGEHAARFDVLYKSWLPEAKLSVIAGQGHYVMWSAPETVSGIIRDVMNCKETG